MRLLRGGLSSEGGPYLIGKHQEIVDEAEAGLHLSSLLSRLNEYSGILCRCVIDAARHQGPSVNYVRTHLRE